MDFLRNLKYILQKGRGAPPDSEQGLGNQSAPQLPTSSETTGEKHESAFSLPSEPIDPSDKLATFRLLCGIATHPLLESTQRTQRLAPNIGIYTRVVRSEQNAGRSYKYASFMINGCLGLQIIVAAALTAMGAANTSHGAITTFGAINTVIAGMLTYLKGSGLPNRIKYYKTEWRRLREFIEQKERDFTRPNCPLDVYEVIDAIEVMYEEIKTDIEHSVPDSYHSASKQRTTTLQGPVPAGSNLGSVRRPVFMDKLDTLQTKYGDRVSNYAADMASRANETQTRYNERAQNFATDMASRASDAHKEVQQHVGDIRAQGDSAHHEIERVKQEVEEFARRRMSQVSDMFSHRPGHGSVTFSHTASGTGVSFGSPPIPTPPAPTHPS